MNCVDVVIVGGGVVGNVLAKGLVERTDFSITLLDESTPDNHISPEQDKRVIALAQRTVEELNAFGIGLDKLQQQNPGAIKHIEVSDKGWLGLTDLYCQEFGLDSFGQVVSLSALTELVGESLSSSPESRFKHYQPISVNSVTRFKDYVEVALSSGDTLNAKCVVLADGGRSSLSDSVGITRNTKDYGQTAIICNLHTAKPHEFSAFERFTTSGPLAFLPYDSDINGIASNGTGFSVVWTLDSAQKDEILSLSDTDFICAVQRAFGYRAGRILRVSERVSYPLALRYAENITSHRIALVGNAAQSLHPIAGQGFNLGLRDITGLVDTLALATDPGEYAALEAYSQARQKDRNATINLTDTLVRVFSNDYLPMVVGRNLALLGLGAVKSAKSAFVRQTTGFGTHTFNKGL
ncbi:2-octaprenyl-6-methoxyphenyl hydroxylase [Alteromonas sp. KUL49]|uniref:2-octaprenyl-6-methoxyphenyl hydroxylase n=1 Tax=Alteromonas sp. KUL49 TaxID=2480798 RepID=UPI00102ED828|nr:2-octaprenyl-6-methoxyphenyl hydroxylase [Alteromonas sp. KUL49]TAP41546.1 2-octaprenyl-6-methoxyphenyl hydroxylase [Alteromonas sp. KUL49]GEA10642.1 2-octaprenyl-6-methoxyphenyl hydroxylase [Alteromonas sp. KUL49]